MRSATSRMKGVLRRDVHGASRDRELPSLSEGRYRIQFAKTPADLERVTRLRFEVFNLELGEGLDASYRTGLDRDAFDLSCDHLMVLRKDDDELVGTYRMQTIEIAREGVGLYCGQEFDFSHIPDDVIRDGVELGRACIAPGHRNGLVLFALWRGLAVYVSSKGKRWMYGCSSLTSRDPAEGWRALWQFERDGCVQPSFRAPTRPEYLCGNRADFAPSGTSEVAIPRLFRTYLRYGARVCSEPALDREFRTIDFLVLLDLQTLTKRFLGLFFHGLPRGGA